jgi:hypothetical protein
MESGFNMNDVLRALYACMKEGKSFFNFLSDEDLGNLSAQDNRIGELNEVVYR